MDYDFKPNLQKDIIYYRDLSYDYRDFECLIKEYKAMLKSFYNYDLDLTTQELKEIWCGLDDQYIEEHEPECESTLSV